MFIKLLSNRPAYFKNIDTQQYTKLGFDSHSSLFEHILIVITIYSQNQEKLLKIGLPVLLVLNVYLLSQVTNFRTK